VPETESYTKKQQNPGSDRTMFNAMSQLALQKDSKKWAENHLARGQ
jgi:hypothetical protein